jgi:glutamate 5-kinase
MREKIALVKRVVIKVGTRVLVDSSGKPDLKQLSDLVIQISELQKQGKEIILVSSGAIGSGMEALGMKKRPKLLPEIQMCAAVGQSKLMFEYSRLFELQGIQVGQVLLTHDNLTHRVRHLNARNTINTLLENKIVPIINENDVVAVDDIKLGDNDILASLVTLLVDAELLVLLTSAEGLLDNQGKRISNLGCVDSEAQSLVSDTKNEFSSGGMKTKLEAAKRVNDVGAMALIANGKDMSNISKIFQGNDIGTMISGKGNERKISAKKKWIGFFKKSDGGIVVDEGAKKAIIENRKSLLAVGIKEVKGEFEKGSLIDLIDLQGNIFGKGLSFFSSANIGKIKGKPTSEIEGILGDCDYQEVIHRDNLVLNI